MSLYKFVLVQAFDFQKIVGGSLSKPHTSESNGGIFIYYVYICHTSFHKCKFTLLTRNIAHPTRLLLSEFYLHRFRLQVLLLMDTHTSSRRALKLAQEQEVVEDWRRPRNERQSSTCCRDFETKERESEGREVVLGTLLKLLVKDKLLRSGKVPVNAELRT